MNHSALFQRFLEQLNQRGLTIYRDPKDPPDQLRLGGPADEKTPEIMRALKVFKPQLLEIYGEKKASAQPEAEVGNDPEPEG